MTFDPPRRAFAAAAIAAATIALSACSLTRTAPVKETYLLEPAMPPAAAKVQPLSVHVSAVNVAAPYRGRAFVYRTEALRYETDYYVEFLVAPMSMFTEQTSRALEASHAFVRVLPPGSTADADLTLEGFVSSMYADARDGKPVAAELVVTYYLIPTQGGGNTPTWSHEYRRHVDLATRTAAAYAAALNTAFGDILAELTRDLAAQDLSRR